MRIVCVSDTHGCHGSLGPLEGDILIHAGDFTNRGLQKTIISFNNWLGEQDFKHKIVIAGNHDIMFGTFPERAQNLITNATYLEDSGIEVEGINIWGSPWTPTFGWDGWVFNQDRGSEATKRRWAKIPDNTDILITHGPPYGAQDMCPDWKMQKNVSVGCRDLTARLHDLNVKYNICGHIHESHGASVLEGTDTLVVNASIMNQDHDPYNASTVIDYE